MPHHQPACPMCSGDGVELGSLGTARWYRCRDCGMQFCRTPKARRAPKTNPTKEIRP